MGCVFEKIRYPNVLYDFYFENNYCFKYKKGAPNMSLSSTKDSEASFLIIFTD